LDGVIEKSQLSFARLRAVVRQTDFNFQRLFRHIALHAAQFTFGHREGGINRIEPLDHQE